MFDTGLSSNLLQLFERLWDVLGDWLERLDPAFSPPCKALQPCWATIEIAASRRPNGAQLSSTNSTKLHHVSTTFPLEKIFRHRHTSHTEARTL